MTMKFGRGFHLHQVPEWAPYYIRYNVLKKLFKAACASAHQHGIEIDVTELLAALNQDLEKVESFYLSRCGLILRKKATLCDQYGIPSLTETPNLTEVDRAEIQELLVSFTVVVEELKALQWYGEANRAGFRMIASKLGRLRYESAGEDHECLFEFEESHFARQNQLLQNVEVLSKILSKLSQASLESQLSFTHFSLFLPAVSSCLYPASDIPNVAYVAISKDTRSALDSMLDEHGSKIQGGDLNFQFLLFTLLRYSVLHNSKKCIESLLSRIQSSDSWEGSGVTTLQHIRACLDLPQKLKNRKYQQAYAQDFPENIDCDTDCQDITTFILDRLRPEELQTLMIKDASGRLLLHDAAAYGLPRLCQIYLNYMQDQNKFPLSTTLDAILSRDVEGRTPLCLAVISGSSDVTKILLDHCANKKAKLDDTAYESSLQRVLDDLLPIAVKSDFAEGVKILLAHGANANCVGIGGETALYIAAQFDREKYVKDILESVPSHTIAINLPETSRGWTALTVACVEGFSPIVKCLVEAGADQEMCDLMGWTAKEHAAFRGHLKIARLLASRIDPVQPEEALPSSLRPVARHRYRNTNTETHIMVTLGSPNTRDNLKAVDLNPHQAYGAHSDLGYIIEVVATDTSISSETSYSHRLPLLDEVTYQPWHFTVKDASKVNLRFNVYHNVDDVTTPRSLIGSGVVLLQSFRHGLASNREGLARYCSIPILEKETLNFMGTVTFGVVVVTPFAHEKAVSPMATLGFWKDKGPTQVVGHRGSGANTAACTRLQIGENSIQSFLSARALGASCVEFDVQLTKDLVPVIFHDFLVMEAGGDTPLYTLSLNQFLQLSEAQSPRGDLSTMAEARYVTKTADGNGPRSKPRSHSLSVYDESRSEDLARRMKHTKSAMEGAHKGNLRGQCIQGIFPTFENLFTKLPESVAFNVEMKYPMLWEAEDRNMDTYAPEINAYIDIVLDTIYRLGGERSITFSSFSPEVCIALSIKQQDYPILFLSKSGAIPVGDVRCSGLQQAIQFAKRYRLAGIVMFSDPLILCPRLVQYAKSAGLRCCSYGPQNNEPECAKIQAKAGLDAIIVDRVRLISNTLADSTS